MLIIMASSCNIKHSAYIVPHTWEPCVPNSLTHRLDPCQHLVVTERLEICGRNCLYSKQAAGERIRNLDQAFICPLCRKFSHRPTIGSEDVKAGDAEDEAKNSPNSDSIRLRKTTINNSIANLHLEERHKNGDMRMNEIQCKSVL